MITVNLKGWNKILLLLWHRHAFVRSLDEWGTVSARRVLRKKSWMKRGSCGAKCRESPANAFGRPRALTPPSWSAGLHCQPGLLQPDVAGPTYLACPHAICGHGTHRLAQLAIHSSMKSAYALQEKQKLSLIRGRRKLTPNWRKLDIFISFRLTMTDESFLDES
jgi:hypothetical protein